MSELDYPVYPSSDITPREVIAILRRRRWTIVLVFALCVGLMAFYVPRITPIYEASATMVLDEGSESFAGSKGSDLPVEGFLQQTEPLSVDTQVQVLMSAPLRENVLKKLKPIPPGAGPKLHVLPIFQTNVVQVTAESTDPRVARDAANTLIREYISESQAKRGASIRTTRDFVDKKLRETEPQLARADARLRTFKEQHHLPDLSSNRANAISEADRLRQSLIQAGNRLSSLRSQINLASAQLKREPERVLGAFNYIPNPAIDRINQDIERFRQQRITLLRTLRPTEPEVQEVDQQIARLRAERSHLPATIRSGIDWIANPRRAALEAKKADFESQARGLEAEMARLRPEAAQADASLVAYPAWETTLARLQRERDQAQETQRALSEQLRNLRIWEQTVGTVAWPLSPAGLPAGPIRPQPVKYLLIAAVVGLVLGIGGACLRDMTDDRLYTAEDAERIAGLPILGRVPVVPRRAPVLIAAEGESPAKEAYRRLHVSLSFAALSEPVRSLLVTSAIAGEGKSTVAANLAVATALQGQRVILVDADFRCPSLAAQFSRDAEPGLSDVLAGRLAACSALRSTDVPDLLLMPAGSPVPSPARLLADPGTGALLQELTGLADLVIVDAPPCLPVADAEVLGSRVDAGLLVVGLGQTDKEAVRMARELLDRAHVRLLGVAVNRIKPGDRGYFYRYRYGVSHVTPSASLPAATTTLVQDTAAPSPADAQPEESQS